MKPGVVTAGDAPDGRARFLFGVFHDPGRVQDNPLDAAQIAHEYAQFSAELADYYLRWPRIEASCVPSHQPDSGLLVRLLSDLPADAVHNSLAALLVHLNQRVVASRSGQPSFVMQQITGGPGHQVELQKG